METLEAAINAAGGITRLAENLGIRPNVISNWKLRNRVPRGWEMVLVHRYARKRRTKQPAEA